MRRQTSEKASGALLWGDGGCFTELYDIEYLTDILRDRTISIPGGGAVGDRSGAEAGLGNAPSKSRRTAVFQEELTDKLFTYFFLPPIHLFVTCLKHGNPAIQFSSFHVKTRLICFVKVLYISTHLNILI